MHTAFFGAAREHIGPIKGSVIDCIDRTLPYLCEPEIVCAGPSTEARINETSDYGETRGLRPCIDIDAFEFEFDPSSRTVSYLGRLGRRKNVSCLLKAWSAFEAARPGYSLIIAGTGSEEQRLKALAAKLGVQNVEFRGFVSEREKVRLYERSLLSVIPSRMEGYVTTGLEALAAGTPVVGADTYGINDYLTHRENGFLFSDNDPASLARVLEAITDDPEALEPVAKNGRRTAEKHSREAFGRRARQLFADLLVEHRSNR
ncbi:glycosyl transferase group 1 [Halobacteriales archaeon QS_3_64_16]|nr:MAG: glycosyl transferase group 1 [Halobacteriales archaeon QS_3_64_16]